jgi:DNA mismatch repair protein MutH
MTISPPRDEQELSARAAALAGLRLGELAETLGFRLGGDAKQTKGTQGTLVERLLGAGGRSGATHDFPALSIELKTLPVTPEGRPRESTFVCSFSLATADRAEWASSWARAKLGCVLWVPIVTPAGAPMAERRVGTPLLWRPTAAQEQVLAADFDEILGLIGAGHVEALTARTGRFLQARPKAAHSRVRTRAFGPDDELMEALPRGLYLRAFFTGALLRDPAALPDPPARR